MSVDILSYFKQLLPVYENDESVYCISAWNDQVRKQKTHKGGGARSLGQLNECQYLNDCAPTLPWPNPTTINR